MKLKVMSTITKIEEVARTNLGRFGDVPRGEASQGYNSSNNSRTSVFQRPYTETFTSDNPKSK